MKRTGAATFTEISVDEMRKFLRSAFHALTPQREENTRGELTINLPLSDKVEIKVFTSMFGREQAGVGSDAIRVGLYRGNKPLKSGHWPIVKRTQNWRDSLRERIEDMIEKFDADPAVENGGFVTWP